MKEKLFILEVAEKEAKGGTWTGWAVSSLTSRFYQPRQNREGSQTEKKGWLLFTNYRLCG